MIILTASLTHPGIDIKLMALPGLSEDPYGVAKLKEIAKVLGQHVLY